MAELHYSSTHCTRLLYHRLTTLHYKLHYATLLLFTLYYFSVGSTVPSSLTTHYYSLGTTIPSPLTHYSPTTTLLAKLLHITHYTLLPHTTLQTTLLLHSHHCICCTTTLYCTTAAHSAWICCIAAFRSVVLVMCRSTATSALSGAWQRAVSRAIGAETDGHLQPFIGHLPQQCE